MNKDLNDKKYFSFNDFNNDNIVEYKRKYLNEWSDLKKIIGYDDIEILNNELTIINKTAEMVQRYKNIKKYKCHNYVLRIMSGMGGLSYSN